MAALRVLSAVCFAQTIAPGTVELSGVTGLNANRQTISTVGSNGQLQASGIDVTSVILGVEGTYFVTARFGIGAVVSYQRLSAEAPDRPAIAKVAATYFGPFAQVRLPLGGRSQFVVVGSYGGTALNLVNQNTGVGSDTAVTAYGKYWLVGGGLGFGLTAGTSFDLGVRYQHSTFGAAPGAGKSTAAGLLVSAAVSVYFGS
jgi:hypothetical protein